MWRIWESDPEDFDEVHPHRYLDTKPARQFIWEMKHGLYRVQPYLNGEPIPRKRGIALLLGMLDERERMEMEP